MPWSYKPLFRIMLEKDLRKKDLMALAKLHPNTVASFGKGEPVTMDSLGRICEVLHCRIEDVVEYIPLTERTGGEGDE